MPASVAGRPAVGIFLDADNLSGFLKNNGASKLVEIAREFGNPMLMRAYGNWSNASLEMQHKLLVLGFELVHAIHPRPGKNSADIAMVIDAIDIKHTKDIIKCFVLATGDSDFTPLFRNLRESGRQVVGVGPKSVLGQYAQNLSDRFFYIDNESSQQKLAAKGPEPIHAKKAVRISASKNRSKSNPLKARNDDVHHPLRMQSSAPQQKQKKGKQPKKQQQQSLSKHNLQPKSSIKKTFSKGKDLLRRALQNLPKQVIEIGKLKTAMLKLDGSFHQKSAGYARFSRFLQASYLVRFKGSHRVVAKSRA
jgi:hypothetical protein